MHAINDSRLAADTERRNVETIVLYNFYFAKLYNRSILDFPVIDNVSTHRKYSFHYQFC